MGLLGQPGPDSGGKGIVVSRGTARQGASAKARAFGGGFGGAELIVGSEGGRTAGTRKSDPREALLWLPGHSMQLSPCGWAALSQGQPGPTWGRRGGPASWDVAAARLPLQVAHQCQLSSGNSQAEPLALLAREGHICMGPALHGVEWVGVH